ncbi:MAG: hypothetical protein K2N87_09625 [Eubacterium sp.]|nr:hypothetical protein [Eubacterium sp.]
MNGREDRKENDLFFTCSLIDYIARKTKNRRADVYHSDNIDRVCDDFIASASITEGNFDSVADTVYALPSHWDIGKVFKRLILGIARERQMEITEALFAAYNSFVSELIEDFNSSFYYDAPQNILNTFLYENIE